MRSSSGVHALVFVLILAYEKGSARRTGGAKQGKSGRWVAGTKTSAWHECRNYVEDTEHDCFPLCVRGAAFECIAKAHQRGGMLRADSRIYRNFDGNSLTCDAAGQTGTLFIGTEEDRSAFNLRWGTHRDSARTFEGKWTFHWGSVAEHHPHSDEQWFRQTSVNGTEDRHAIPRTGTLTLHFESLQPVALVRNERSPIQAMRTQDAGSSFFQPGTSQDRGLRCRGDNGWSPFMPLWLADVGEINTVLRSCLCEMDFSTCSAADTMKLRNLWNEPMPEQLSDAVNGGFRLVDGRRSGDIQEDDLRCLYPWNGTVVNGRAPVDDWSGGHQAGLRRADEQVERVLGAQDLSSEASIGDGAAAGDGIEIAASQPTGSITDTLSAPGASSCNACASGKYDVTSTAACIACVAGKYVNVSGSDSASDCSHVH